MRRQICGISLVMNGGKMRGPVGLVRQGTRAAMVALALSVLATACSAGGEDPEIGAICAELEIRSPGRSGDVLVRERTILNLAPAIDDARERCPELFPRDGEVIVASLAESRRVAAACRTVVDASEGAVSSPDDLEKLDTALSRLQEPSVKFIADALDDECGELPADLETVALRAATTIVCGAITETDDADAPAGQREVILDRLVAIVAGLPRDSLERVFQGCGTTQADVEILIAERRDEIAVQAAVEAEAAERAAEERAAAARAAAENAERERRAQIDPGLLRCYESTTRRVTSPDRHCERRLALSTIFSSVASRRRTRTHRS